MNIERVKKLIEYLYPTTELMDFMYDDLYQELMEIIPINICLGSQNENREVRVRNLKFVENKIEGFIIENMDYKNRLLELYKYNDMAKIRYNILIGLVFYMSNLKYKYNRNDIFRNKNSVCYEKICILDFI